MNMRARFALIFGAAAVISACGQVGREEALRRSGGDVHPDASTTPPRADAGTPPADASVPPDSGTVEVCLERGAECSGTMGACCAGNYCEGHPYSYTYQRCTPLMQDGDFCLDSTQCATSACIENICGGPQCHNEGEECYGEENPCCAGFVCDVDANHYGVGHCIPPRAEGEMCGGHEECASGNCVDNLCAPVSEFSFTRVYSEVLVYRGCADVRCHGGGSAGLSMSDMAVAYHDLVGRAAAGMECGPTAATRVVPYDPEASLLMRKVTPGVSVCGSKMPSSTGGLPDSAVTLLRQWIAAGVPR